MKFKKNNIFNCYFGYVNDEAVAKIDIHYNWFDHSNYYTVDGKQFNYLKDAKEYCIANH